MLYAMTTRNAAAAIQKPPRWPTDRRDDAIAVGILAVVVDIAPVCDGTEIMSNAELRCD